MKKWMYVVICSLFFLFILVIVGYEVFITNNFNAGFLVRAGLCEVSLIVCILKTFIRPIHASYNRRVLYRKAYAEFIEGAFSNDKKLEKKLLDALEAYNQQKYAASLGILNKLLTQCICTSDRYAVTVFQALCCHDMELFKDAIGYYETAMLIRPNTKLASNQGICYEKIGDYEAASRAYHEAVQLDPNNDSAFNNMAQMYMSSGNYEYALKYATLAYERNQKLVPALNAMAVCNYMLGDYEEYERWYRQAVASGSDPTDLKNYIVSLDPSL